MIENVIVFEILHDNVHEAYLNTECKRGTNNHECHDGRERLLSRLFFLESLVSFTIMAALFSLAVLLLALKFVALAAILFMKSMLILNPLQIFVLLVKILQVLCVLLVKHGHCKSINVFAEPHFFKGLFVVSHHPIFRSKLPEGLASSFLIFKHFYYEFGCYLVADQACSDKAIKMA